MSGLILLSSVACGLATCCGARPVHSGAPLFFGLHGERGVVVPAAEADAFAHELGRENHSPVVYAEPSHRQHGFDALRTMRGARSVRGIHRFLNSVYGDHLRAQGWNA